MGLQNFVDKNSPAVSAAWLNVVDTLKFTIFGDATTKAIARTNLTSDAPLEVANGGTASRFGGARFERTAAEIAASITPTNYGYLPGDYQRYGADPLGVSGSATAISNAMKCNTDVFDSYPGGGIYLIDAEMVYSGLVAGAPITVRGQAAQTYTSTARGTVFLLGTSAGSGAATIRTTAFVSGLRIQNIGFFFQSINLSQFAIHSTTDLRAPTIEGCQFSGGGANSTNIAIQMELLSGTYTGGGIISGNYFQGCPTAIKLKSTTTTIKIIGNEIIGYAGAAGAATGSGIEMDYPVTSVKIIGNYFEGWTNGIYSNGAEQIQQIGNDFQVCTHGYNWVQTSYASIANQSIGDNGVAGITSGYANLDSSQINQVGILGLIQTGFPVKSTYGFQEGDGGGSNLRTTFLGYKQTGAGVFSASGSMTWSASGNIDWVLVGKTMTVWWSYFSTTIAGTPDVALQIQIPLSKSAAINAQAPCAIENNGTYSTAGVAVVVASGTLIKIYINPSQGGNWTASAGNGGTAGSLTFPVI